MSLSLPALQALAAFLSFVFACAGCGLARKLENARGKGYYRELLLIVGNTFASGILLAAALTHMLPDAMEALADVTDFPLAPTCAGGAFCFLVLLGETIGEAMPKREEPHTHTACVAYEASFAMWPRRELMPPHGCEEAAASSNSNHTHVQHCNSGGSVEKLPVMGAHPETAACGTLVEGHSCHSHSSLCRVHRHSDAPCAVVEAPSPWRQPSSLPQHSAMTPLVLPQEAARGAAEGSLCGHDAHEGGAREVVSRCHVRTKPGGVGEVKSFFLFFALGFHSVMEGLGLGSTQEEGLLLSVMVAILAHKALAAFALGCSLTQSELPNWKFWAFVLLFAVGTPLGCAIGAGMMAVGSRTDEDSVGSGICISLASGTFLQVASMELLPRVLAEDKHKILGCLMLMLGFGLMSLLALWV